jgi:hypothetical protein
MSDAPTINFTRISGQTVVASYTNLPPGAAIVFVDKTSGESFGGFLASGAGSAAIPEPAGLRSGDYYLKAQDSTGAYLAQSVEFHIDASASA